MKIKRVMNYEIDDIKRGDNIALNIVTYHEYDIKTGLVNKILNDDITILTNESIEYTGKISDINIEKTIELSSKNYLQELREIELDLKAIIKIVNLRLDKLRNYFNMKGQYNTYKRVNEIKDYLKITSLDHVIDKITYTIDWFKTYYKE